MACSTVDPVILLLFGFVGVSSVTHLSNGRPPIPLLLLSVTIIGTLFSVVLGQMSLTFQQIICDAKKLVGRISDHENTADNLISEIQSVCNQIDDMKQYQEEVDLLNTEAKERPHNALIAGIQQETRHLREVQAENKELRNALEDHQNALELIMSKYRQQTASLIRKSRTDISALHNSRYANIITSQAEKINEMATVMRVAAALDEESELKYKENYTRLKEENSVLREIVNIANKYGSLNPGPPVENKTVQTEPS